MSHSSALPSPEQSYDTIHRSLYANAVFSALQEVDPAFVPRTAKQAQAVLEMAQKLAAADEHVAADAGLAGDDPFVAANQALDAAMQKAGFDFGSADREEQLVKQAAEQCFGDPALYNSMLSLRAKEAELQLQAANQA